LPLSVGYVKRGKRTQIIRIWYQLLTGGRPTRRG
jgi:hypothetical protein